jgi:superfamily II DNA or RNA helicase
MKGVVIGMSIGLQNPSKPYTEYELSDQAKALLKSFIEGFRYHPLFFMLRSSVVSEDPVYPFAHQLELMGKLFARKPLRVLIGDEIGLGKTISTIMLIKYLTETERVKKILILVPRVLIQQWIVELKRFSLASIMQLERDTILRYHDMGFPQGIYIASIDLAKREKHKGKILKTTWDLVVVDEAHRVGRVGSHETQRFMLVSQLVGSPNVNVIMLTATPHRGKPEDYIERLKLIDPLIKADPRELDDERFYRLCMGSTIFRRTKPDINEIYEKTRIFTNCKFKARVVKASEREEVFHIELIEFLRKKLLEYYSLIGDIPKALPLLMTLIAKRASSNPRAAIITLDRIIQRRAEQIKLLKTMDVSAVERELDEEAGLIADTFLGYSFEDSGLYEDEAEEPIDADEILGRFAEKYSVLLRDEDVERLKRIHELARDIMGEGDSRLKSLINVALNHLGRGEKIVVFTEFRDTAEYLFSELKSRLPRDFADKIAMITSREIIPPTPYSRYMRKYDIEDVKKWLRSGDLCLLVSTDVASEGLNLQVANVVIHYEPTWSPVKIVQRIGRVWRLGQERDVHSYSLLLTVESDIAALEILYAKLLSWMISGVERQVPIGEELEIDMLPRDKSSYDILQIPLTTEKGKPQYSEFKAWIEFIAGGKEKLRRYVEGIITALMRLKEQAKRLGLARIEPIKVEKLLDEGFGNLYGKEAEEALKNLLVVAARLHGYEVEEKESGLFIKGTHITGLKTPLDIYRAVESLLKDVGGRIPVTLVAGKQQSKTIFNIGELYLYEVTVYISEKPIFSETVGVAVREDGTAEICRGVLLLKVFSELLSNLIGIGDQFKHEERFGERVKATILFNYRNRMIDEYVKYLAGVERGFSFPHKEWIPREGEGVDASHFLSASHKLLGVIASMNESAKTHPPPIAVEEVERKAMEYAIEFERRSQRIPEDVSGIEHYDIKSLDPRTGEVRFIEVKGRWHLDIAVELTEAEYEYARKLGGNYWLYIVYGFSTGSPRLLAIRDPANRARWSAVEIKRYRLLGA